MRMRSLINLIENDIQREQKHFASHPIEGGMQYLISAEVRKSVNEINAVISNIKVQIEANPKLTVNEISVKPLLDFLINRWERIKNTAASYDVCLHSASNIWCRKMAEWLSDPLGCNALILLIPTLNKLRSSYPRDFTKHILNDANDDLIDVYACLYQAYEKKDSELKYFSFRGEVLSLSNNEKGRVLYSEGARKVYDLIVKDQSPVRIGSALLNLQTSSWLNKNTFLFSYHQQDTQRLIANLFKTKEELIDALTLCEKKEWPAFLSNFTTDDLCFVILQCQPADINFKPLIQSILQDGKIYLDNELKQGALAYVLIELYTSWMKYVVAGDFNRCIEEIDIVIISELLSRKQKEKLNEVISEGASDESLAEQAIQPTPVMLRFYSCMHKLIRQREVLATIIKNEYISNEINLVDALSLLTQKDEVLQQFLNIFSYEEMSHIWFDKVPVDKHEFIHLFTLKQQDDALYEANVTHNRYISYALHHYYSTWRLSQEDHMKKVPFIGWNLGCPKQDKLLACDFNKSFLMSGKEVSDYHSYMELYAKSKQVDLKSLEYALTNGTMLMMTNRMKKTMDANLKPVVAVPSLS